MFSVALFGGAAVFFLRFEDRRQVSLLVAFSGAFLLSLIFMHLLPGVYRTEMRTPVGVWVMVGFSIQVALEFLSGGVEHGHDHALGRGGFPFLIFSGLAIHAFLEGMPIGHLGHAHDHSLLVGILLHKLPVAIVLTVLLRNAGLNAMKTWIWLGVFGLMSPLGSWTFGWIQGWLPADSSVAVAAVTALLVGILLHVSTTILFEGAEGHTYAGRKLIAVILGLVLGALV